MCDFEILTLCIRCCKGLITYNKTNDIIAMKKHVEVERKHCLNRMKTKQQVFLDSHWLRTNY
jgi:hypothetical protein